MGHFEMSLTFFVILWKFAFFLVLFTKTAYFWTKRDILLCPVHWCQKREREEQSSGFDTARDSGAPGPVLCRFLSYLFSAVVMILGPIAKAGCVAHK